MKLRLYLLAILAFSVTFVSCKKDEEPEPIPEVVGKWSLDYGVLSGFSNTTINGAKIDPFSESNWGDFFYTSQIHVLNNQNKTFVEVFKAGGFAEDLVGTWTFEGNSLTLKYDQSDIGDEVMTYRVTNGLEELVSQPIDITLDEENSGKIQYVYRK